MKSMRCTRRRTRVRKIIPPEISSWRIGQRKQH